MVKRNNITLLILKISTVILLIIYLSFLIRTNSVERKLEPSTDSYSFNEANIKKYNVVFIVIDTLRFDHLGCYGYFRNTSPNIDKLCKESIVFENAVSQAPITRSAMVSIWSSRYYNQHNITNHMYGDYFLQNSRYKTTVKNNSRVESSEIFLPNLLLQENYSTFGITENLQAIMSNGFQKYETYRKEDIDITKNLLSFISNNRDKNFFAYAQYMNPHSPYNPPKKYSEKYLPIYTGNIDFSDKHQEFFNSRYLSDMDVAELLARYDGEVNAVDEDISRIISALKEYGIYNNTIIVITSDHGEALAEKYRIVGHGFITNRNIQVPLIVKIPNAKEARISYLVESIDIAPTLLYVLGIKQYPGFSGDNLFNKKDVAYSSDDFNRISVKIGDYLYLKNNQEFIDQIYQNQKIKLRLEEIYNIKKDPNELFPLNHESVNINLFRELADNYSKNIYRRSLTPEEIESIS